MPIIYGFLERITYYNEENDFVVAKLQEKGNRPPISTLSKRKNRKRRWIKSFHSVVRGGRIFINAISNMRFSPIIVMVSVVSYAIILAHSSFSIAQEDISDVVKKVLPSIVTVNVFNRDGKWRGSGTGFIVKEEGLLITNRHVIDGRSKALAKFSNGEFVPIEGVLSEDRSGDLILLALGVKGLSFPTLSLTDKEIITGQPIIVIGSPLGKQGRVLQGIVSGVKEIPNFGKIITHTAAISKGSSGSPILNVKGEVIGVVVGHSIVEGESLGFAISVDRVKWLLSYSQAPALDLFELVNRDEERWLGLLLNDRYDELIHDLRERIKINPNNALSHFYLGSAYSKLSRNGEAVEEYKQAIRNEPDDPGIYYHLGVSYIRLGIYDEAAKIFKQALRIKPNDAQALLDLGFCYGELGSRKKAIEAYKQAIRIKPDFSEAHYNLGEAYLRAKKKEKGVEQYRILKSLDSELAEKLLNLIPK